MYPSSALLDAPCMCCRDIEAVVESRASMSFAGRALNSCMCASACEYIFHHALQFVFPVQWKGSAIITFKSKCKFTYLVYYYDVCARRFIFQQKKSYWIQSYKLKIYDELLKKKQKKFTKMYRFHENGCTSSSTDAIPVKIELTLLHRAIVCERLKCSILGILLHFLLQTESHTFPLDKIWFSATFFSCSLLGCTFYLNKNQSKMNRSELNWTRTT